jgi:dipeptidyl aminopeptidase/acylaminoacyl peptidase
VLSPPGAAGALPTVLAIHGGPTWHWTPAVELGLLCLVAAGYRVALPNIRGSYGFGYDWVDALRGDWGGVDADDCHTVCDHLVAAGAADPARLGCFGRSYGGFLVNWLIGTSQRFAAAVSECGVANNVSAYGQSDCGASYNRAAGLGEAISPEGVAQLWRQSPLRHVSAIRTPLLMLQGEADLRCPRSDTEQLFVALRWLGREVSYVLYPEGDHVYHRLGRPDRRADRHARLVGWFQRHMPA